jgi:hypothetical protein
MDGTLLELVELGELTTEFYKKTDENLERAAELERLGFKSLAEEIVEKIKLKDKLGRISEYGYLRISVEKIEKFLDKKVELYNARFPKPVVMSENGLYSQWRGAFHGPERVYYNIFGRNLEFPSSWDARIFQAKTIWPIKISRQTIHFAGGGDVGQYVWTEARLSEYKSIPPSEVLEALREHQSRKVFDYFTIASVNELKDPLLLGRTEDCEDRWFIKQWGEDIHVEDVI